MASNDYEGITKVARNRYFVLHSITKLVIVTSYSLITSLVTSLVMLQCAACWHSQHTDTLWSLGGFCLLAHNSNIVSGLITILNFFIFNFFC